MNYIEFIEKSEESNLINDISSFNNTIKRKNYKKQRQGKGLKTGHWSQEEKCKYYTFIQQYYTHFTSKILRRSDKIFKLMANHIETRGPDQCRSHHQKLQKKYNGFENILQGLKFNLSEGKIKCKSKQRQLQIESEKIIIKEDSSSSMVCDEKKLWEQEFDQCYQFSKNAQMDFRETIQIQYFLLGYNESQVRQLNENLIDIY